MLSFIKKKPDSVSASETTIDKSQAIPGFTQAIEVYASALRKLAAGDASAFLYANDKENGNCLCFLSTTFFARINNHPKHIDPGFSMYFNKTILGDCFDRFVQSEVANVFIKEKGVIESPGAYHEKGEYYIRDFGYDAESASAVIAMLLKEVFNTKPEDIHLQIQVFSAEDGQEVTESNAEYDNCGNKISSSGLRQDLF